MGFENLSPPDFEFAGLSYDLMASETETESQAKVTTRKLRADLKHKTLNALKRERLAEIMPELPRAGECYHIISNGDFDYWTWVPVLVGYMGRADEFHGSTWTMNRGNVNELLAMLDDARIGSASVLTGIFFKRRESSVYATILLGLTERGQRFAAMENHAKVALMANHERGDYLVIEGSANWTANPRIEQNIVANDRELYEFHKAWIDEVLDATNEA